MLGALPFVVVAAALQWLHAAGGPHTPTATLDCPKNETPVDARASYRVWSSFSVRLAESSFTQPCAVNVAMAIDPSLQRHDGQLSPFLLLMKIDQLQLIARDDSFHVMMSNPVRWSIPFDCAEVCGATYLWAGEVVQLRFSARSPSRARSLYEASFFVTEATNVCGNESHSPELVVESDSKFVFAPDVRNEALPPNNVRCSPGTLYFVSIRPSVASAVLTITALACPSNDSCGILQISGRNCSDGMTVEIPPHGGNATLSFLYRTCKDSRKFVGFTVSAHARAAAEPSSTLASTTRSSPANTLSAAMTTKASTRTVPSTPASWTGSPVVAATGSRSAVATSKAGFTAAGAESSQQTFPTSDPSSTNSTTGASVAALVPVTGGSSFREHDASSPLSLTAIAASGGTLAVVAALVTGVTIAMLYRRRRSRRSTFRKQTSNVIPGARRLASDSKEQIQMVDNDLYGELLASTTTNNQ